LTSNRGLKTTYDASGVVSRTVLAAGEFVSDLSTGQMRHGDGTAVGGLPQVAQFPKNAFQAMSVAYDRVFRNLSDRFVYSSGNHLWPGVSEQTNLCHQPDTTTPPTRAPNPWTWACIHTGLYERWRCLVDRGDANGAAAVAATIASDWAYMRSKWSLTQLKTLPISDNFIYYSDDGCHYIKGLRQVIEATGDATAKAVIQEAMAYIFYPFLDPLQTGADLHVTPAVTPDGHDFKWNTYGFLYGGVANASSTGYRSSLYEAKLAHTAAWLGQQSWVSGAYRTALLAYAKGMCDHYNGRLRTVASSDATKAVAGIHWIDFNLDPDVANVNARGGGPDSQETYHTPYQSSYYGAPIRGHCAHFPDGSAEVACLNYQLWVAGFGASYLAEFEHIIQAMTDTRGYARDYHGVRVFGVMRDAWVDGQAFGDLTRCVRQSIAAGNTTTDPTGFFRQVVVNTAKSIIARSSEGYMTADWMGRSDRNPGSGLWTWLDECANNYAGSNGAAFGNPRMLTTNGNAAAVVGAAGGLAAVGDPALLRSGLNYQVAIETLAAEVAALTAATEMKADLVGGQTFSEPFNVKLFNTGFHHDGVSLYVKGDTAITRYGFNRSNSLWEGTIGGSTVVQVGGGSFGVLSAAFRLTSSTALYASGNGWGVSANGAQVATFTSSGLGVTGQTAVTDVIYPVTDAVTTLGKPSQRWSGGYFTNAPQVTSDERDKQWRGPLNDDELAAAREIAAGIGVFQWHDAIAVKGADKARLHFGVQAQRVWAVMQTHGLIDAGDPTNSRYAFLCYDEWGEEDGQDEVEGVPAIPAIAPPAPTIDGAASGPSRPPTPAVPSVSAVPAVRAGNRYGVRYEELAVFLIAAQEQRLAAVEAALAKAS
jgi:hypothetical protein